MEASVVCRGAFFSHLLMEGIKWMLHVVSKLQGLGKTATTKKKATCGPQNMKLSPVFNYHVIPVWHDLSLNLVFEVSGRQKQVSLILWHLSWSLIIAFQHLWLQVCAKAGAATLKICFLSHILCLPDCSTFFHSLPTYNGPKLLLAVLYSIHAAACFLIYLIFKNAFAITYLMAAKINNKINKQWHTLVRK